ncbi:MAG: non-canonical purine NTP pyrophosphatase [Myxococcota bacterium]|nr:non-canonical purine NTP pyrophosphatase [Myxococcota bacterium]
MTTIVVATGNHHKYREYSTLLAPMSLSSLADYPAMEDVEESYDDFAHNAAQKANAAHRHTGVISLADDSGLEVQALGGRPGVRSKRYFPGTDQDRYEHLLTEMADIHHREARFVCAIAIAGIPRNTDIGAELLWCLDCVVSVGYVYGRISRSARGNNGFGYDPVFELPDGRTIGELPSGEKESLSHRFDAVKKIKPWIQTFFIDGLPSRD